MRLPKPGVAGMLLCGYCPLLSPGKPFTIGPGVFLTEPGELTPLPATHLLVATSNHRHYHDLRHT